MEYANDSSLKPGTEQEGNLARELIRSIDKKENNKGIFKAYIDYQGYMRHIIVLNQSYNPKLYNLTIQKYEKWKTMIKNSNGLEDIF